MAEREVGFTKAFREAGGVRRRASVPYPLTHESIRKMCEKRERILRIQFEDEKFSDEDERALASLSIDHPDQAFQRFTYLMGLWHAWERGYRRQGQASDPEAVRWLTLNRVPIRIRVAGHDVEVTSRSMAAMARMYRHDEARLALGEKLDLIEAKIADASGASWLGNARKRRLHRIAERVEREWEYHLRGILANALTPDGSAALPEEAPEWWDQVSDEEEVRILVALWQAGPGRMERGRRPYRGRAKDDGKTLTFRSLLRHWEPKLHLPPMALEDHDLAQLLTALEDGAADGVEEKELEEALT